MFVNFGNTKFMLFCKEHDSLPDNIRPFVVQGHTIERVTSFKYLGIVLDPALNFNIHYDLVLKKICSRISFITSVKRYLNIQSMKAMVNAHLHSVTDYCLDIWAIQGDKKLDTIQMKIDKFLCSYFYPRIAKRKAHKVLNFSKIRKSEDMAKIRNDCNFLTLTM